MNHYHTVSPNFRIYLLLHAVLIVIGGVETLVGHAWIVNSLLLRGTKTSCRTPLLVANELHCTVRVGLEYKTMYVTTTTTTTTIPTAITILILRRGRRSTHR